MNSRIVSPPIVLQTVRVFMDNPPPAPYLIFVDSDGWRFDCGNCVGWSMFVPKRCRCGHCLPGYEPIRAARAAEIRRATRARQQRDRRFWKRLKKIELDQEASAT